MKWTIWVLAVMLALSTSFAALAANPSPIPQGRGIGIAPAQPAQPPAPVPVTTATTVPAKTAAPSGATTNTVTTTSTGPAPLPTNRPGPPPASCPTTLVGFAQVLGLTTDQASADHFTAVQNVTPLAVHYFWLDHPTTTSIGYGYSFNDRANTGTPVQGPATFTDFVWTVFCDPIKIAQPPAPMPSPRLGGPAPLSCPPSLDQVLVLFNLDSATYASHWIQVNETPIAWHYFWSGHPISATLPNGFNADTLVGPAQTGFVSGDVLTLRCVPAVVNQPPAPLPPSR